MMWLAYCSFAPLSRIGVDAIPHLCIVAQKTPVLILFSFTHVCLGSVISSGFSAVIFEAKMHCNLLKNALQEK